MNPSAPTVLLSLCLLTAAVAVWLTWWIEEPELVDPGRSEPLPTLKNWVDDFRQIGAFEDYYGREGVAWRERNPFIPYRRRVEEDVARREDPPPGPPDEDTANADIKPPVPPRQTPLVVVPPKRHYPAFSGDSDAVPVVHGQLQACGETVLQVSFGGRREQLRPGDSIGDWELLRAGGSFAWFADPEGAERQLPIGMKPDETMTLDPDETGGGEAEGSGGRGRRPDNTARLLQRLLRERPELRRLLREHPDRAAALLNDPRKLKALLKERQRKTRGD